MKYENISGYADDKFRKIAGVRRATFEKMLEILRPLKLELDRQPIYEQFSLGLSIKNPLGGDF